MNKTKHSTAHSWASNNISYSEIDYEGDFCFDVEHYDGHVSTWLSPEDLIYVLEEMDYDVVKRDEG